MTLIIFQSLDVISSGKETALFLPLKSPPTDELNCEGSANPGEVFQSCLWRAEVLLCLRWKR